MSRKPSSDEIIWTIKELYEWAVENGYEKYTVFTEREGCDYNIYKEEILINSKKKTISL